MQSNAGLGASKQPPHVRNVNATSGGLLKATLGAAIVAGAILTFVWLPAEYGVDPTGVGHVLGLEEMGRIKQKLHAEADEDAALAKQGVQATAGNKDLHQKLDEIQAQLTSIAITVGAPSASNNAKTIVQQATNGQTDTANKPWQDENDYTLAPGASIEVKLVMKEGAIAVYEWNANGAFLNHDTHGDADSDGQEISYTKGRSVPGDAGELVAAFTGQHGWFWRNRTGRDVVITLRTRGDYDDVVLP